METIFGVLGVFFVPATLVALIVWFKSNEKIKRNKLQAELYAKALEKGQPVPSDLFAESQKKKNSLKTGLVCMASGIGLSLGFLFASSTIAQLKQSTSVVFSSFSSFGVIPFLIGVAYVIIHFIEKKNAAKEDAK